MKGRRQLIGPFGFGVYEVAIHDGKLSASPSGGAPDGIVTPGFVDIHIHGCNGLDVTENPDQLAKIEEALLLKGYEYWMPTTACATAEANLRVLQGSEDLMASLGVHVEGPFISPFFPGAQPPDQISEIADQDTEWSQIFDHPNFARITLAPEVTGAPELIQTLSQRDLSVSIGHSNCTAEEARQAVENGAQSITHVFNAMRPFHHREPGPLAALIDFRSSFAEFIYDGNHIDRSAVELCRKIVGPHRMVSVSDATKAAGLPEGSKVFMWGQEATVSENEVRLDSTGALAGSTSTLDQIFPRLVSDFGAEFAILTCAVDPLTALGKNLHRRVWVDMSDKGEIRQIHKLQTL